MANTKRARNTISLANGLACFVFFDVFFFEEAVRFVFDFDAGRPRFFVFFVVFFVAIKSSPDTTKHVRYLLIDSQRTEIILYTESLFPASVLSNRCLFIHQPPQLLISLINSSNLINKSGRHRILSNQNGS